MGWHHEWMNGLGGFMFPGLGLILIIALVIVVIWALNNKRSGSASVVGEKNRNEQSENPLNILKRRYAAGEISKDEYDRIRNDLDS